MKKLQNNFTTPEQSQRLLELGVPADSADCVYRLGFNEFMIIPKDATYTTYADSIFRVLKDRCMPCWSVGRLMEIYGICMGMEGFFYCKGTFVTEAIRRIEYGVKEGDIDFSKLEE